MKHDAQSPQIAAPTAGAFTFGFNAEKIPGHGEDADPLVVEHPEHGVLLGVFDGMGGSGATVYQTPSGEHSGAYLASRQACETTLAWFDAGQAGPARPGAEVAASLHDTLVTALQARVVELGEKPRRIASRMIRQLPTTAALLLVEPLAPQATAVRCRALWAGDSRAFALTPREGLAQLTTDHLRGGGDAHQNLISDAPMSNFVSASAPFEIADRGSSVELPAVLFTATDGCFGYLPSPASFESAVLATLAAADGTEGWATALRDALTAVAADDVSMALVAVGWSSFDELRAAFDARRSELAGLLEPIEQARRAVAESRARLDLTQLDEAWVRADAEVTAADAAVRRTEDRLDAARLRKILADHGKELQQHRLSEHELAHSTRDDDPAGHARRLAGVRAGIVELERTIAQARQEYEAAAPVVAVDPVDPVGTVDDRPRLAARDRLVRDSAAVQAAAAAVWDRYRGPYERHLHEPCEDSTVPDATATAPPVALTTHEH